MRLIDADEEIRFANENLPDVHAGVITAFLRDCSTIDPVHAAGACYCGECRNCVHQPGLPKVEWICVERHNYCECGAKIVTPNHFCSYGVKKE